MATTKGQKQRRKSKHGRIRRPNLSKIYGRAAREIDLSQQEFRITVLRPDMKTNLNADGITESLEWRWDPGDPVLHGTINMRKPATGKIRIVDGHQVKLEVWWLGAWHEVWRMRLYNGTIDPVLGNWNFELHDDGILLQESRDDFHFVRSKKKGKPNGWKTHEIMAELGRTYRIPLGKIAAGRHQIRDLSLQDASIMEVIQRIYAIEKQATGRRFVIQWRNGKLNVMPLRRNSFLYTMQNQIIGAVLGRQERNDAFATAVTVRATIKDGKRKKKIVTRYANKTAVKREGFVHKNISGSDVESEKEALNKAKRYVAKHAVRKRTASITHYGIAFLRRGDAIQVVIPEEGYVGKQSYAFVSSGSWALAQGSFTMDITLGFDDPFVTAKEKRKQKDKKTRAKKRSKRK